MREFVKAIFKVLTLFGVAWAIVEHKEISPFWAEVSIVFLILGLTLIGQKNGDKIDELDKKLDKILSEIEEKKTVYVDSEKDSIMNFEKLNEHLLRGNGKLKK